ncbi:MAG: 16S rRNA (adenine(1518)-N(6)/adenine(1519)-N(6))-dimethyltransferase RsmA [Anaerolineae bacterium]|jgi:16S rRNA (adenine1518-N6/adenine1519-N6)-dimethyltransferase|nr:16S rRNA (adenine(1518)-N(6)/adenine(1519)-N(6))-dimethyltransferase RsmA [Anaerolineae bacterium]
MSDPRELLGRHDLRPRKSLGQNFLVDPTAPARIADCAGLTTDDTVLEVGAGVGTLTAALASRAGAVIAVETDLALLDVLSAETAAFPNVRIVHGDILLLDPVTLLSAELGNSARPLWGLRLPHYHVVANLPYYITNAVVRHLLEARVRPAYMALTVQREVAERIVAQPGGMSLLAVSVQFYGRPELCLRLRRGAFFPPPKVESAVVRIATYEKPLFPVEDVRRFFQIVRAGFAQRRKQLRNSLSADLALDPQAVVEALRRQDIDSTRRPETLSMKEWGQVYAGLGPLMNRAEGG